MLLSTKALMGYVLHGKDGEIGRCKDFLFDDEKWVVRYMVADTGKWLPRKRVLISPIALRSSDWRSKRLDVRLDRAQIENAPHLDDDAPVSRQYERQYAHYYGFPPYWRGPNLWGAAVVPGFVHDTTHPVPESLSHPEGDPHLQSVKEVTGYHIEASDGKVGHVEDFIIDQDNWKVHYLVVDTRNWLPGPSVVIAPEWIESVNWPDAMVKVPFTTEQIKSAPEYDPHAPVNRIGETRLYDYYGRPRYW